jgi:hypothetical protein
MPTTLDLVKKAIGAMKERTGSSTIAITKWLAENEKVSWLIFFGSVGDLEKRVFSVWGPVFDPAISHHPWLQWL